MKGTAPRAEGHYPDYRFPPPPEFILEEGNHEIRSRQLEMVDSYSLLHHDVNIYLTLKGASQFTDRSDGEKEALRKAYAKLNETHDEVVRGLAHIIRLGGTPPPPDKGVSADVSQLLDAPAILIAAYQAAGVPAPAPPPAAAPRPNPPAARSIRIRSLVGRLYPRGRFSPTPLRAPLPAIDAQVPLPGDQAGIRPLAGLLHPQGEQADIRPLDIVLNPARTAFQRFVQEQHRLISQGQTDRARELAQARLARQQAQQPGHVQQLLQLALPVQEQPQAQQPARPVQEPVHPAPMQEPVRRHVQQQLQLARPVQGQPQAQQPARPVQERVRPAPMQEPVRRHVQQQLQLALPVQEQPQAQQPSRPVQERVRPAANKRGRDDTSSSSGSRRRGR